MLHPFLLLTSLLLSFGGFTQSISQKLDDYLTRPQKKQSFHGTVLVAHQGKILLHKGYGYKNIVTGTLNDTAAIYRIGSLTKPFTATVILRLAQEGKLSLKDKLSRFLPAYPLGDKITVEELLTHSSGVKEYLGIKAIQLLPDSAPPVPLENLISYFSHEPLSMQPGKKFSYSNSNYILLAAIVQEVTGHSFEAEARSMIFEPLQMHQSGFDFKHLSGTYKATGCLDSKRKAIVPEDFDSSWAPGCGAMYSTSMDIYRWYRGLNSGLVISDSVRAQSFQRRKEDYGYGWFNEQKQGRICISHAGGVPGFLANLQFYPADDLCVIMLSNSTERDIFLDSDQLARLVLRNKK